MTLEYKNEESENILEYFSNTIVIHSKNLSEECTEEEDISTLSNAISCLQNGINPLRSCQIISNTLQKENQANFNQYLFDTGIIRYILPFINKNTDIELLEYAMNIIYILLTIDQPSDSPLQNETFLQDLISILSLQNQIQLKLTALDIIYNLLHDENIYVNVFIVLKKIDFLKILQEYDFFNPNYAIGSMEQNEIYNPLFYSSSFISDFSQMYQTDELICLAEFIPILSQALINDAYRPIYREYSADALSNILKNFNTHPTALRSEVPENCVKSLSLYHEGPFSEIFECIYNLLINDKNNINDSEGVHKFFEPTFIRQCTHLLESYKSNTTIMHILKFLDFYLPKYFPLIDTSNFTQILSDIALDKGSCKFFQLRITSSLVLIRCIPFADDKYFNFLFQEGFFNFVFNSINSYDKDDTIFIIHNFLKMFERKNEMKEKFLSDNDFQEMLNDLASSDDEDIAQLPHLFYNSEVNS